MISTGNDIVSLSAVNITRTKQPRFYSKILSDAESLSYHQQLATALPFENYVWLLWSIKESAFKFLQRFSPAMLFTPVEFVVEHLQIPATSIAVGFGVNEITSVGFDNKHTINATVSSGSNTIYSRSLIYPDLIMTVVNQTENFDHIHWGIKWINDEHHDAQSLAVREFLLKKLRSITGFEHTAISKNAEGIPILLKGIEELNTPVSLSHHGHFIAYAFNLQ